MPQPLKTGPLKSIQCHKQGNIKVWVLPGDKPETAVNIGFACQLLSEDMPILEEREVVRILEACWESNNLLRGNSSLTNQFQPQVMTAWSLTKSFWTRGCCP